MSRKVEYARSLAAKHPDLLPEWDYSKNMGLSPNNLAAGSQQKAWWKCNRNHIWEATADSRARGGGCPYCSGNRVISGETDFFSLHPELMSEWHWTKNRELDPHMCAEKSGKKAWWKCSLQTCGQEWEATIANRSNGRGCPSCTKKRIIEGKTDFAALHPDIAKEWAYDRNNNCVPEKMPAKTQEKVWWHCSNEECGQYWQASLANRSSGTGCPYCNKKRAIPGKTDFATLHPVLMTEWNYEKNHSIEASSLREGSNRKVWWKCSNDGCGNVWEAVIRYRAKGQGCPQCAKQRLKKASLAAMFPGVVKEWDYNLNKGISPENVRAFSSRKVWWKCSNSNCQMNWQASIAKRANGRKCPHCSGNKVTQGKNDLASCFPELLDEWNYELNSYILPNEVAKCSSKVY